MSSSFRTTGKSPTQRGPAWKRLGLKLKPASDDDDTHQANATSATSSMPNSRTHPDGSTPNGKRRASGGTPASDNSVKRAKQDHNPFYQGPKKAKSVSFTADTADASAKTKQQNSKNTSTTAPAKRTKSATPINLEPALVYLRAWHTSRESWKFNKNHQTKLLEHVFADANGSTIPTVDIDVFYEYIRGLQGGVRARLRELASGIHAEDIEQGAAGFAATDAAERRQKEYEDVIARFLDQPRTPGKRRFAEVDYVLRTTDMEMQRRVVKRMRAEVVLDELAETGDSTTTPATTTKAASTSADTATSRRDASAADGGKRLQLNDGPQQRTKRKRKARTAAVEDDTSSESSSSSSSEDESDSDASSSGSSSSSSGSSDSSEDSDGGGNGNGNQGVAGSRANEDTSSSSSSSSDSTSESETDDEED
ncbi:hypothetical protein F4861DRAFT_519166 [Xylaria intraflava]|nr:hypothetical protein F4861DRAFT_519166 [Xylaria intraflava]